MKVTAPQLPVQLEEGIALEEALSMAGADEAPLEAFTFHGGSAAGAQLEKVELFASRFAHCRFTGAALQKSDVRDCLFENCDFAGARFLEGTLRRCVFRGCKLAGTNFGGASLEDVRFENCTGGGAVFSEAVLKNVAFDSCRLDDAWFADVRARGPYRFADCALRRADFLRTPLAGQDLSTCDIEGMAVAGPELKGAKVSALQACELARLLGVTIV